MAKRTKRRDAPDKEPKSEPKAKAKEKKGGEAKEKKAPKPKGAEKKESKTPEPQKTNDTQVPTAEPPVDSEAEAPQSSSGFEKKGDLWVPTAPPPAQPQPSQGRGEPKIYNVNNYPERFGPCDREVVTLNRVTHSLNITYNPVEREVFRLDFVDGVAKVPQAVAEWLNNQGMRAYLVR